MLVNIDIAHIPVGFSEIERVVSNEVNARVPARSVYSLRAGSRRVGIASPITTEVDVENHVLNCKMLVKGTAPLKCRHGLTKGSDAWIGIAIGNCCWDRLAWEEPDLNEV